VGNGMPFREGMDERTGRWGGSAGTAGCAGPVAPPPAMGALAPWYCARADSTVHTAVPRVPGRTDALAVPAGRPGSVAAAFLRVTVDRLAELSPGSRRRRTRPGSCWGRRPIRRWSPRNSPRCAPRRS
jgi:hypothetical protein